jgi:glutathione synthase
MRICFVVNAVRTQRLTYTTMHLAFEARRRGHEVHLAGIDGFSYGDDDQVLAQTVCLPQAGLPTLPRYWKALTADEAPKSEVSLSGFDVVFLRNNPATLSEGADRFNPAIDFGRRLKRSGVMVVNDPDGLLRAGSKMYLAGFPEQVRPKTLITRSAAQIKRFLKELDSPAILKPLAGFGGQNVFYMRRGQISNLNQMISAVRKGGYVIAQEYLHEIARGDKRVLLVGGEPVRIGKHVAAYKRMRPKDDIRNNIHVGGQRKRCDFTETEQQICDLLRPRLVADGLYFVGVDVVGDKVLEINVFAPGGIHNINELYKVNVGEAVIQDLEKKVAVRAAYNDTLAPDVVMKA